MYLKIYNEWYLLYKIIEFLFFLGIYVWMFLDREYDGFCFWFGWGISLGSYSNIYCLGLYSVIECLFVLDLDL